MALHVKVVSVRLDPATGAFDDAELVAFTSAHDVVSVQNHLLTQDGSYFKAAE